MNHTFISSTVEPVKCAKCKRSENDHIFSARCEACGDNDYLIRESDGQIIESQNELTLSDHDILMCRKCSVKDNSIDKGEARVSLHNIEAQARLQIARKIDHEITVSTEFYNAETIATVEVKRAIDSDNEAYPTKEAKQAALNDFLVNRFHNFQEAIFESKKTQAEALSRQRAISAFLNTMESQVRAEVQARLKIADVSYTPTAIKVQTPKPMTARQLNTQEMKEIAAETGLEFLVVRMLCLQNNWKTDKAAIEIRRWLNETKSIARKDS